MVFLCMFYFLRNQFFKDRYRMHYFTWKRGERLSKRLQPCSRENYISLALFELFSIVFCIQPRSSKRYRSRSRSRSVSPPSTRYRSISRSPIRRNSPIFRDSKSTRSRRSYSRSVSRSPSRNRSPSPRYSPLPYSPSRRVSSSSKKKSKKSKR